MKINKFNLIIALIVASTASIAKPMTIEKVEKELTKANKELVKQETKVIDLIAESKSLLAKSKILKDEGNLLVELGQKGHLESLNKYTSFVVQMGKAQNSKALKQEVKYLRELLASWEDYDEKIKDGEKTIEKSTKLNVKGIKTNDEASEMMAKVEKTKAKIEGLVQQKETLNAGVQDQAESEVK